MKIRVTVSLGIVGCKREKIIEIFDDCTDDEIEAEARDTALTDMIEWTWERGADQ